MYDELLIVSLVLGSYSLVISFQIGQDVMLCVLKNRKMWEFSSCVMIVYKMLFIDQIKKEDHKFYLLKKDIYISSKEIQLLSLIEPKIEIVGFSLLENY